MNPALTIRDLRPDESDALGRLLVDAYSGLEGFPTPAEQPGYYEMLAKIGRFAGKPATRVLVALTPDGELLGGSADLDFSQQGLPVFGFRLKLQPL